MTRAWLMIASVLSLMACKHGAREREFKYRATGTVVHDGLGADDAAGWATEIEILTSDALLQEVRQQLVHGHELAPDLLRHAVTARRRAGSRVIEVSVGLDDSTLAQAICMVVVRTYIDRKLNGTVNRNLAAEQAFTRELDELRTRLRTELVDGGEDRVLADLYEKKLSQHPPLDGLAMRNDVHVLDPCQLDGEASR